MIAAPPGPQVHTADPVFALIDQEYHRQLEGIELIASENFASAAVRQAAGSVLTNKYAEGLPGKRYYGGCQFVDEVEDLARERVKKLFGAVWANVQPHSGAQANAAVYLAYLKPGDTILGFDLAHGGHLTHGSKVNSSGKLYRPTFYGVEPDSGRIDYNKVAEVAQREQPRLIICGASAYSRDWDYAALRQIADRVGALLMADIAHPAGLIAAGLLTNPLPHCHWVTTTTHKTLRGPRGGLIMMGQDFPHPTETLKDKPKMMSAALDSGVFPGTQGGPLMHIIAAKAIAFQEALQPAFKDYTRQVVSNARTLAQELQHLGYDIFSGGTDNHLMLLDLRSQGLTGKEAEAALGAAEITVNKNMIPYDPQPPMVTSGIRLGTAAVTTRGLLTAEMQQIAHFIHRALQARTNPDQLAAIKAEVRALMTQYPLP